MVDEDASEDRPFLKRPTREGSDGLGAPLLAHGEVQFRPVRGHVDRTVRHVVVLQTQVLRMTARRYRKKRGRFERSASRAPKSLA